MAKTILHLDITDTQGLWPGGSLQAVGQDGFGNAQTQRPNFSNSYLLSPISEILTPKSVSRTYTTYQTTNHKSQVTSLVRNLIEEACGKLREMSMGGRTFGLRLDEFKIRKTISYPTNDPEIIFQMLTKEELPDAVRFVGIWISNLVFSIQCSIFNKKENLLKSVDKLNDKFGLFTVYPARLLGSELIRPEVTGFWRPQKSLGSCPMPRLQEFCRLRINPSHRTCS